MNRTVPVLIALAAFALSSCKVLSGPRMGETVESFELSNHTFKLRVDMHAEVGGVLNGAYYVFRTAPIGTDNWHEIMTFRHDDPNPIPRDQVRFVNERVAFVFMGWMYAVTTDAGATWTVWDSSRDLPKWQCCNYRLVQDVKLDPDGAGIMTLNVIPERGEVPVLHTKDFGRHWSVDYGDAQQALGADSP